MLRTLIATGPSTATLINVRKGHKLGIPVVFTNARYPNLRNNVKFSGKPPLNVAG